MKSALADDSTLPMNSFMVFRMKNPSTLKLSDDSEEKPTAQI